MSAENLVWLRAKGARGKLHLAASMTGGLSDDETPELSLATATRVRTPCGRLLRGPSTGVGIADVADGAWSPRCWDKLPPAVQKAWKAVRA